VLVLALLVSTSGQDSDNLRLPYLIGRRKMGGRVTQLEQLVHDDGSDAMNADVYLIMWRTPLRMPLH
jgi:hypothetical protein